MSAFYGWLLGIDWRSGWCNEVSYTLLSTRAAAATAEAAARVE